MMPASMAFCSIRIASAELVVETICINCCFVLLAKTSKSVLTIESLSTLLDRSYGLRQEISSQSKSCHLQCRAHGSLPLSYLLSVV